MPSKFHLLQSFALISYSEVHRLPEQDSKPGPTSNVLFSTHESSTRTHLSPYHNILGWMILEKDATKQVLLKALRLASQSQDSRQSKDWSKRLLSTFGVAFPSRKCLYLIPPGKEKNLFSRLWKQTWSTKLNELEQNKVTARVRWLDSWSIPAGGLQRRKYVDIGQKNARHPKNRHRFVLCPSVQRSISAGRGR